MNQLINDRCDCRTAPARPGLFNICYGVSFLSHKQLKDGQLNDYQKKDYLQLGKLIIKEFIRFDNLSSSSLLKVQWASNLYKRRRRRYVTLQTSNFQYFVCYTIMPGIDWEIGFVWLSYCLKKITSTQAERILITQCTSLFGCQILAYTLMRPPLLKFGIFLVIRGFTKDL